LETYHRYEKIRAERTRNYEVTRRGWRKRLHYAVKEVRREAREAERKILRERVAEAHAAEERGDSTSKRPRWM
jgi:predicted transcriptional regulator